MVDLSKLLRVRLTEYGRIFASGVPVTFLFVRGTSPSPKPGHTDPYQQRLEPAGRYMVHNPDPGDLPRGWEKGVVHFQRPLVIPLNANPDESPYGEHSWKAELSKAYGGRTGRALSRAILASGYDGIVTVAVGRDGRAIDTREIVDLGVVARPTRT